MRASTVFWQAAAFLVWPTVILTVVLYTYPALFGCSFPLPSKPQTQCFLDPKTSQAPPQKVNVAPFRLLVIGDPQLEGDSSLPSPQDQKLPGLASLSGLQLDRSPRENFKTVGDALTRTFKKDIPRLFQSYRKRLDLWGNDRYLAHIYRAVRWWVDPTHVTVLGDLLGSQWVSDEEFEKRSSRFWNVVFKGGSRVDDAIAEKESVEMLGEDPGWSNRIINVAGNHDIGYAGDINEHRLDRFERAFGKANWDQKFLLPPLANSSGQLSGDQPELRIVVLNSMNLDSPVRDYELQLGTYNYIEKLIDTSRAVEQTNQAIVLLTHIPLLKKEGLCVDGSYFAYGDKGIKEQNHLSEHASKAILGGIFGKSGYASAPNQGLGRNGIILTGHDHSGCDVYHYVKKGSQLDESDFTWEAGVTPYAGKFIQDKSIAGIREITMRSMMGDFSGYTGMLSGWFDEDDNEWKFAFAPCPFAVQHLWWAVHVADIIVILLFSAYELCSIRENNAALNKPSISRRHKTPANGSAGHKSSPTPKQSSPNRNASNKSDARVGANGHLGPLDKEKSNKKGGRTPKKKT